MPPVFQVDSNHPLYRRPPAVPQDAGLIDSSTDHIDLSSMHLPSFGDGNTVVEAINHLDKRIAATVSAATGFGNGVSLFPSDSPENDLLEQKEYDDVAPTILIPTAKCLAALAYPDFFPDVHADGLRPLVSEAILAASSGWCGSIGPLIHDTVTFLSVKSEGNYDISQMHLLQMAYAYYDEITPAARDHLITVLLASGRVHRIGVGEGDVVTSGGAPGDWSRAGFISPLGLHKRIGETENHILTIHTARYLTNQLLYQRDHDPNHDNRRNGSDDSPTCTNLMLMLLRNILCDDFSEYNAKPYQDETRAALLNLCSYAYDHEVRLGARMVLDYVSARIAVSSSDLRRMVPFRRRNEDPHVTRSDDGFMQVGLLETDIGADPLTQHFAILAGNTRAYEHKSNSRFRDWSIATYGKNGNEAIKDALSDYRIPLPIHDLFVTDLRRRFFQRMHHSPQGDPEITGRNVDFYEIFTGSPSYLISAGGIPTTYAINPNFAGITPPNQEQQIGVAYTTSFIPTTRPKQDCGDTSASTDVIQFSSFSDSFNANGEGYPECNNYGVGPDFACGFGIYLPEWVKTSADPPFSDAPGFHFVDRSSGSGLPGFYLAIYKDGKYALLEAFDTWLHSGVSFDEFKARVLQDNSGINLRDPNLTGEQTGVYTTQNGTRLTFLIWEDHTGFANPDSVQGAKIINIQYGPGDPNDRLGDAGNVLGPFLNGTVLNSAGDGSITINNPLLQTRIVLDMTDQDHPLRISENGAVEQAGFHNEVWVDFSWKGQNEGDFFHPFSTIAGAAAAVANGGTIRIVPGLSTEKPLFPKGKRFKIVAPIGNVAFGIR